MSQRMRAASGASSSSHARKDLPLIDCPQCFIPIIRLVSRQPETYGQVFYKCENNSQVDSFSCPFFKSEASYERYLRRQNLLPSRPRGDGGQFHVAFADDGEDQGRLCRALEDLKQQIVELNRKIELPRKNVTIACVCVVAVVAAYVGCLFGLVVALLLKQN